MPIIKVQRTHSTTEETSVYDALSNAQALEEAELNSDNYVWNETEVITHYQIVETVS